MNENLIQVLWVEDDPEITQSFPLEAALYGIQLVPFACWQEAEEALRNDFKRWSAIVLDAKCKYKKDNLDNASVFLMHALSAIKGICAERGRQIPWYILSGGSEQEIHDLILEDRKEWDGDWTKGFYSKNTDRELLYQRIPYQIKLSPQLQLRLVYYKDVFQSISNLGLDEEFKAWMEDLLLPIHTLRLDYDYNTHMTLIRKCFESLFQSMANHSLLPSEKDVHGNLVLNRYLKELHGTVNLAWCSKILAGKNVKANNDVVIESKEKILPRVLEDSIHRLVEIAAAYEHAINKNATPEEMQKSRQTAEFLESIHHAPYLLRSMTYEFCCIILWVDQYLKEHDDAEINALNWEVKVSK